jgi:uncharacterized membrane protein YgcG
LMTLSSPKLPSTLDALDEVFGFHVVMHATEALAVLCYVQPASSTCILSASPYVHLVQILLTKATLRANLELLAVPHVPRFSNRLTSNINSARRSTRSWRGSSSRRSSSSSGSSSSGSRW